MAIHWMGSIPTRLASAALLVLLALMVARPVALPEAGAATPVQAQAADPLAGIVSIQALVPADARTAAALGTRRTGSGVVIDDAGLIVTIGYVILEAREVVVEDAAGQLTQAEVVAYDHQSGLGLVRTTARRPLTPVRLGSAERLGAREPLLAAAMAGGAQTAGVYLTSRRPFAGYWEYLLEDALFTSPPFRHFAGAGLLDREGRLVGIGSLRIGDAAGPGRPMPGNMFVPIDALIPIMADLLANGRRAGAPRPWLGAFFEEHRGRVFVTRITPEGPAAAAGLAADDLVVGLGEVAVTDLAGFYRQLWQLGPAGTDVPLQVLRGREIVALNIRSGDRYRHLKLDPTY